MQEYDLNFTLITEVSMKYVLILGDGMADYPIDALGGKTPMAVANKPYMNSLAKLGKVGMVKTVPDGMKPGSDVANLGALGYDAKKCYTGRSPLEALSMRIDLSEDDVAVRTNLVTLSDDEPFENKIMIDYSAGEISTEESTELINYIEQELGSDTFKFYAGVSYRHCLILSGTDPAKSNETIFTPPHDISGKRIGDYLPKGLMGADFLALMKISNELLKNHPINRKRVLSSKKPANNLWFWGQGTKPALDNFKEKYGLDGGMISAVDLLKGIAIGAGMTSVDVAGATGTLDSNFDGKAASAISLLDGGKDFVFIHLEAPDECGHQGDIEGKIKAIEIIDEKILKPVYEHLKSSGNDFAILVMPDHRTPIALKTHSSEPVPYLLYSSKSSFDGADGFDEFTAENGDYYPSPDLLVRDFFSM